MRMIESLERSIGRSVGHGDEVLAEAVPERSKVM